MKHFIEIEQIMIPDDGVFPNSAHPALFYKGALDIPMFFPAAYVKRLFEKHDWSNSWDAGMFEYDHYHSIIIIGILENQGERPGTDKNIARLPLPSEDPLGLRNGLSKLWNKLSNQTNKTMGKYSEKAGEGRKVNA